MQNSERVISIYVPPEYQYIIDSIKDSAEKLGLSLSDYILHMLWNCSTAQKVVFTDNMATPKIQYPINSRVTFKNLDPLSYYVLTKLGIKYDRFRAAIKKYGIPSIFFVKSQHAFKIAEEVNKLLDKDTSGKLKWYIVNANIIAKEQGLDKLLRVNREIKKLLAMLG